MLGLEKLDFRDKALAYLVTPEIDALVASIPKPVGSFGYDAWGYNEGRFKVALGLGKLLYDKYFRVTTHGLENVPAGGRVLIIGNHSGQLPMDGILVAVAMATSPHGPRLARAMIERFFPTVPWLGNYLNSIGAVIGDPVNCVKMLEMDEAIIVFPEGIRGSGKPYRKRYQLQRFGNGFMHLATGTHTPIVPVGVVGCEETMPALANLAPLAKLLGLPYLPVVPSLLPLPARVHLRFGAPMHFAAAHSEDAVTQQVEQVKDSVRTLIAEGLQQRTSIF
jgi:1-acyl-sn-glycerol-3-phosphate acyltransferase